MSYFQFLVTVQSSPANSENDIQLAIAEKIRLLCLLRSKVESVNMGTVKKLAEERGMRVKFPPFEKLARNQMRCSDCVETGTPVWYVPDNQGGLIQRVCKRCGGTGIVAIPVKVRKKRKT